MIKRCIAAAIVITVGSAGCEQAPAESAAAPPPAERMPDTAPKPTTRSDSTMPASPPHTDPGAGRTEHTNRLVNETSPYLLQHAHNPVDWYPWGPEAFEAARAQDKLIFLSIGYSTCYWCHVMERESFEDEQTAALMNKDFISIKVDREERPDVDDIYMAATVIYNQGQGGWPMSVFLEPRTLKPIVAGTYFPPEDRGGRVGFRTLLQRVAAAWKDQRQAVLGQADQVAELVVQQLSQPSWSRPIGEAQVARALDTLMSMYDTADGGFGQGTNKFPMPSYLELLIGAGWDREDVRAAVVHTLDRMGTGGMYDQVGGGFHRYSTDRQWLVPHFEKMLYDNGQLASVYADAYERSGDAYYAQIVREILDYVLREMTGAGGAFYSAQDAEVNAREGENYIWTADQVREALAAAGLETDLDLALDVYGFNAGANFQDPHHPEDGRKNVVFLRDTPARLAAEKGIDVDELERRIAQINAALLAVRDTRDQPGTDDKVLAGWNGLMIAGMADGGRVLERADYVDAAARAADFVLETLRDDGGGLRRSYRQGQTKVSGFLEDYALMIRGLIALRKATGEARWLESAETLAAQAKDRFWDTRFGGYFETMPDQSDLFVRTKTTYDGAVPCGNGVMLNNLLDLYDLTSNDRYLETATASLKGLSSALAENPVSAAQSVLALHRLAETHPQHLAAAVPATMPDGAQPVTITPSAESVTVVPGIPATIELVITIADGYHINAHEPGLANLIGLDVQVVGAQGLTATAAWPAGELYQGEIRVHKGTVSVPLRIEQTGSVSGEPQLGIVYQVCTDKVCLMPTTAVLPVQIAAGAP